MLLYQDTRNGQRVIAVGPRQLEEPFLMVKSEAGLPYYAHVDQLVPIDSATGELRPDAPAGPAAAEPDLPIPVPSIPLAETRLNLNAATAEAIAARVPGITYRVAKAIKDLQGTLPQERFANIDQVKSASPRVNWDEVIAANAFFLG